MILTELEKENKTKLWLLQTKCGIVAKMPVPLFQVWIECLGHGGVDCRRCWGKNAAALQRKVKIESTFAETQHTAVASHLSNQTSWSKLLK